MSLILLKDVPSLEAYEVASCDLAVEYWSPEEDGESRRMLFAGVKSQMVPDHNDPDRMVDLQCALFVEPGADNNHKTVANGSKRLVAVFENGVIDEGTPVQVTYKGKRKNRTNGNMSDDWSVVTLVKSGNSK